MDNSYLDGVTIVMPALNEEKNIYFKVLNNDLRYIFIENVLESNFRVYENKIIVFFN